jgi:hydroxymethylpyrimidine/phosphomethylpyrimidine kinase
MDRRDATLKTPIALTIAGSDSGAGAGIQADLKTFAALGVYGASVVTALTAQNTKGVRAVHLAPPEVVAVQIDAVMEDFSVAAIKIGMLGNAEIVTAVAQRLSSLSPRLRGESRGEGQGQTGASSGPPLIRPPGSSPGVAPPSPRERGEGDRAFVVYDPVMAASSGEALSDAGFIEAVRKALLPRVDCLTPNLAEAAALLGEEPARTEADMARQGRALIVLGPRATLMKGGHLPGDEAVDLLVTSEGVRRFAAPRLASRNLHGTGCTLSSAIAAHVVLGKPLPEAVAVAKSFVGEAIAAGRGLSLGAAQGPLIQTKLR